MQRGLGCAWLAGLFSVFCLFDFSLQAQVPGRAAFDFDQVRPQNRLRGPIDESARIRLRGNRHPLARAEYDEGRMPAEESLDRMMLSLAPDPQQQQALEELLEEQRNPESPWYRNWLSPEGFGSRFGVSENDLQTVVTWLEGQGFQVEPVTPGRRVLIFSGSVGQVEAAFHTEMHRYRVNGGLHHANATEPEIPAALAGIVAGFVSLHDFASRPMHVSQGRPEFTSGGSHYLAPADFSTIYDLAPLYASSTNGTGYTLAIVGRSNINLSDVAAFRSTFGLPANTPKVILASGTNPGLVSGDQEEATLDVEWSGAVARNATVELVIAASTASSDGVDLAAAYAVNQNLAPVLSVSFGSCEAAMGAAGNQFFNALWQQAAAQGMSVFVSSGDSGAAGCDSPSETKASGGQGINGLCSPPSTTCVGGTEFNDTANPALYWSFGNSSGYGSAVSYIPETVWNESRLVAGGSGLWGGGGGPSIVYAKPTWQTGNGVPPANHRYVPDVALSAAGHDGYLVYLNGGFYVFAGTSAAAPSFAGIATLAAAREGSRQGNVNPILYGLAAQQASGGAAVFHDTAAGNNSVPGVTGFSAGAGYDPASGLGSVDANLLVNAWANATKPTPAFQLSAPSSATSITQGANGSLKLQVTVSGGFNSAITLSAGTLPSGLTAAFSPATLAAPGFGSSTLTLTAAAQMAAGTYNLALKASGGGISQSVPLAVTIAPRCAYTLNPASAQQPAAAGKYTMTVAAAAGCSWTAASNASWVTVTSGASGNGNGQVSYALLANTGPSRTGTLIIGGSLFQVTQLGSSATFTLNPVSVNAQATGGIGTLSVTAPASATAWSAQSNASWITINGTAAGSGNGRITYTVAPNTGTATRTGTISVAGLTFTVTQAGTGCNYSIHLGSITATASGFAGSVSVTTGSGCNWTAASGVPWITITSGSPGTGNGI
ncbi:MAG TPA: protease pro-enzyme activation domain-containing protein, partial [Bryobacteraceae bacterium]